MKNILLIALMISAFACKQNKQTQEKVTENSAEEKTELTFDKEFNNAFDDPEEEGSKMLLGKINKEGLLSEDFPWFSDGMTSYTPQESTTNILAEALEGVSIKVFMGTWCEDSQREVPKLFSILDKANYKIESVEIIAVTHDKHTPQGFEKDLNIEYVPTIILYKDGEEMGRIVESTHKTLEEDLLTIASGEPYTHMYE